MAAGVCVYLKRLIQLRPGMRPMLSMARCVLLHELAHGLLHDSYEEGLTGHRAEHEAEANAVRKLVWPLIDGYPFDHEDALPEPSAVVLVGREPGSGTVRFAALASSDGAANQRD